MATDLRWGRWCGTGRANLNLSLLSRSYVQCRIRPIHQIRADELVGELITNPSTIVTPRLSVSSSIDSLNFQGMYISINGVSNDLVNTPVLIYV